MYEAGSQVALGLEMCADMDARHRAEGQAAFFLGDTSELWSVKHWAGYQEASTWTVPYMQFPGAPDDWPTVLEMEAICANCPRHITYLDRWGVPAEDRDDYIGD
jgi:hypothetical protein